MVERGKGKTRSKTKSKSKIKLVEELPKDATKGSQVDMMIKQRDGTLRKQRFKVSDRIMWKMAKNPE